MPLHNQDLVPVVCMGGSFRRVLAKDEKETKNGESLIYVSMIPMATIGPAWGARVGSRLASPRVDGSFTR